MTQFIPHAAPKLRITRFRGSVDAALQRALDADSYILGPEVDRFEAIFADYLGVRHCIGVNSGTDALLLACRALDLPAGGEILTVAMTASATAMAIVLAGCTPRFVDVAPETWCIDVERVAAAVGPRTVAIMPVHLHGNPVDMLGLMSVANRLGLVVIEDCAQAHGARIGGRRVGTFGHAAAFSFYPTKNLGGAGDGGAVVTNDAGVAERVRALRVYGWGGLRGSSDTVGYNSRLQELQAAILRELLPHLDRGNAERAEIAARYHQGFAAEAAAGVIGLPPGLGISVYHQFAIQVDDRDAVRQRLFQAGVGTAIHYAIPLHRQPAFAEFATEGLPITDYLAARLLSLPIQHEVAAPHVEEIVNKVTAAVSREHALVRQTP